MFCEKCGTELNDEAIVCTNCGVATSNYTASYEKTIIFDDSFTPIRSIEISNC